LVAGPARMTMHPPGDCGSLLGQRLRSSSVTDY
jgi:hypothetical protein